MSGAYDKERIKAYHRLKALAVDQMKRVDKGMRDIEESSFQLNTPIDQLYKLQFVRQDLIDAIELLGKLSESFNDYDSDKAIINKIKRYLLEVDMNIQSIRSQLPSSPSSPSSLPLSVGPNSSVETEGRVPVPPFGRAQQLRDKIQRAKKIKPKRLKQLKKPMVDALRETVADKKQMELPPTIEELHSKLDVLQQQINNMDPRTRIVPMPPKAPVGGNKPFRRYPQGGTSK